MRKKTKSIPVETINIEVETPMIEVESIHIEEIKVEEIQIEPINIDSGQKKVIKEERVRNQSKVETVYEYENSELGIKRISRKVFHNRDIEIHFPWNKSGELKNNLELITYKGFKGKLPVGVYKSPNYGYGFHKVLDSVSDFLGNKLKINHIIIEKEGSVSLNILQKELKINELCLRNWYNTFDIKLKQQKQDRDNLAQEKLKQVFKDKIDDIEYKYVPNSISEVLTTWGNAINEFSDRDKNSINELFNKLSLTDDFFTEKTLLDTKSKIDKKYIEDVISEFALLMKITTDTETTEKKWQEFLNTHSWIF